MRLYFTFLLLFVGFSSGLSAQNRFFTPRRDTSVFNNRQYKQELGITINGIFAGYVGGSLIWKVRDDRSKLIPVSYSNYWRFQVNTGSNRG